MKLINQDRLPKPEGHETSEWVLDFRYGQELEDEPGDRDRCEAKSRLNTWEQAHEALEKAGSDLVDVLTPRPVVPPPRRGIAATLSLLPPRTPHDEGTRVYTGTTICAHGTVFVRETGRQEALNDLSEAIVQNHRNAGAPGEPLSARDALTLERAMRATYFGRPRPRSRDLGAALKLLRRFQAAALMDEPKVALDKVLAETSALLARYPAPAKKKPPKGTGKAGA